MSSDEELINNTVKLMNTLVNKHTNNTSVDKINNAMQVNNTNASKINNSIQIPDIAYVKTSKWLKNFKCTVNPLNDKKGENNFFEYIVALSKNKDKGFNCNRIKNIALFLEYFNFDNTNYPLEERDYKTVERNNELNNLIGFKLDDEKVALPL